MLRVQRRGRAIIHTRRGRVRMLALANQYPGSGGIPEIVAFASEVAVRSHGRLRIAVIDGWTSAHDPDEERTVLHDLADGVVDLAWVGTRAVGASFGPHALDVLQTPLLFDGEVDLARFITAGGASPLLEQLTPLGLVGLAVLPGEFRRPVGITRPLVAADDWSGAVIRTHSSLPGFAALRSLGATPVLRTAAELGAGVPEGVDGMDLHPTALLRWRFPGWLTENVLLWPRTLLLAAGERSFARLAEPEQQLIRTAAARAAHTAAAALLRRALVGWAYPPHVRVVQARDEELDVLRRTLTVVRDELAAQPQTGWALEHLRARTTRGGG